MSTAEDPQRQKVFEYLARRQQIAAATSGVLAERAEVQKIDPLEGIDPAFVESVEEEYYASQGLVKYVSSNGRVRWLTPEQADQRRRSKRSTKRTSRYYGPTAMSDQRDMIRWGFNIGAVVLAVFIVWMIVL